MRITPPEDDFDAQEVAQLGAEELLRQGAKLFNAGEFHAAHEAWEKVWIAGSSLTGQNDDEFWKGLIQAAIALHHFQRGELEGARKLYQGHRRYLAAFLPVHRAVLVQELLADMQSFLRPVVRAARDARVAFDRDAAPRVKFVEPARE